MTNLRPNSIVYNRRGERARYVIHSSQGHVVMPEVAIIDGEGDERTVEADVVTWHEVFAHPPRAVLDEEIVQLNNRLDGIRGLINAALKEARTLDAEMKARKDRFSKHKVLDRLDACLTNGITHYVMMDYHGPSIISMVDTKQERYRDDFKMLSLFGNAKGDLTWKLNMYYDGSGSWTECHPCGSLEEAEVKRSELFEAYWIKWRADPATVPYLHYYAESARKQGIIVPDDVAAHLKAKEIISKTQYVANKEKELAEAKAALLTAQNA